MRVDPRYAELRKDARFTEILESIRDALKQQAKFVLYGNDVMYILLCTVYLYIYTRTHTYMYIG